MNFEGRVFVISGATGGLGRIAARAFAERRAALALLSTDQDKLDALVAGLSLQDARVLTHAADLTDGDAVQAAAAAVRAKFGRVDGLIHLIGGWTGGQTLAEADQGAFASMLEQHAWTTFHLLQAFVPALIENGWGRVIAVSSPLAVHPSARMGPYAAAKAAQETLLLTLAQELQGSGVTANLLQVKAIDVSHKGQGTPPEEILAAMLYLCTDEAGMVNGVRLPLVGAG
jgi:NAD(P)-dependent dehydrogenase (short-subunit alcohol dehydrogenase family)